MKSNTKTIIDALRILANDIQSEDGVANACIAEAADRMEDICAELEIWKSRAKAHEENYLQMLKRIDEVIEERNLWEIEAKRWRDMYLEYDEMLEGQVQEAVERLNVVWEDLDKLKKKVQDDLPDV